ncbi:ribulose-phosphate 3-epimerase [Phocicoccus pinnipedialis]|uniref:Ribulose-phosphate 3-epimerase n=1 Tax=Phocicoccus pinnipedialis TaxID=110845 RepID=A0A6V7RHV5_9BACL|nr:ribulose-phosphate 3-epimerase [Jeotgalicoccus pinnipedialis]MBP1939074.1 ribulose-phosphate 3-epimerase [Jeotgalicoccus pinnipedialis]CAD2076913.1 Ribulose-phosphate 3-epimerase [Jeotgalicoccus pinnipedialis]
MVKVLPSLLASDFLKLGSDMKRMEEAGADIFHLDIMDGQFVPNISYGIPVCEAIAKKSNIPLDVHLMTEDPEQFVEEFAAMGVEYLSFHIEATSHAHRLITHIQSQGMKAGIVLNPSTPVEAINYVLDIVDFVLVMTVNPGFGGQSFIMSGVDKINELDELRRSKNLDFLIEVDGGVNEETGKLCREAGADLLVSGSFLFKSEDPKQTIMDIKEK